MSFQEDPYGLWQRDIFGIEALVWGSDYPHTESTFPRSREILERNLAILAPNEINQVVRDNVRRIYGF